MNKRITAFLLILTMLLLMAACSNQQTVHETTTETEETIIPTESIGGVVYNPNAKNGNFEDDELEAANQTDSVNNAEKETQSATAAQGDEENTEPTKETTPVSTKPVESMTEYEIYMAKSGEEQVEFYNTFDSAEDFIAWFNAAKAEYEEKNPTIDIGNGVIDASDLVGGNG